MSFTHTKIGRSANHVQLGAIVVEVARDPASRMRADVTFTHWIAKVANAELAAIALLTAEESVDRQILLPSELGPI
jgi:hypothetical protein